MRQILIVTPGSISEEQKKLFGKDVLFIEHENPDQVRIITPIDGLDSNDIVQAMIEGLCTDVSARRIFAEGLLRRIKK